MAEEVTEMDTSFPHELTRLLNRYSQENASNTPDFILSQFMLDCLAAYNRAQAECATFVLDCLAAHNRAQVERSTWYAASAGHPTMARG